MTKITRQTQKIFGSNAGFDQIAQFGSLAAAAPIFTTNVATIQALSNYLTGWFGGVIGQNSPAIEDMNALCYLYAYQLAYLMQAGISEWDSGTTYYTGSLVNVPVVVFLVSSANATAGATYTNNGFTFTVQNTITADTKLTCTYTGLPLTSGTLTKASGTGDATITFTSEAVSSGVFISVTDTNLANAVINTSFWQPYVPSIGKPFQHASVNSTGTGIEYMYSHINSQSPTVSLTVPAGYNLLTGFLTLNSGISYVIAGSAVIGGGLTVKTGASFTVNSGAIAKIN